MLLSLWLACASTPSPVVMDVAAQAVPVPTEPEAIEKGRALVLDVTGCVECHGTRLEGLAYIDGFPIWHVVGPNLTTLAPDYEPVDWVRAIRHGVGKDGHALLMMPSNDYARLTVGDLGAMIAYLEQLQPIDNDPGDLTLGPVGKMLVSKGKWAYHANDVDHDAPIPEDMGARGEYLANVSGCMGCHAGGVGKGFGPGQPVSANITPHEADGIGTWSFEDFDKAMRKGIRPDGRELDPMMPWKAYASWPEDDLKAVYDFLMAQPPQATPE